MMVHVPGSKPRKLNRPVWSAVAVGTFGKSLILAWSSSAWQSIRRAPAIGFPLLPRNTPLAVVTGFGCDFGCWPRRHPDAAKRTRVYSHLGLIRPPSLADAGAAAGVWNRRYPRLRRKSAGQDFHFRFLATIQYTPTRLRGDYFPVRLSRAAPATQDGARKPARLVWNGEFSTEGCPGTPAPRRSSPPRSPPAFAPGCYESC